MNMWSFNVSLIKKMIDIKAEQHVISYFMLVEDVLCIYINVFTNFVKFI